MATGLSRTFWKGDSLDRLDEKQLGQPDLSLSYHGKRTESQILETEPTKTKVLWEENPESQSAKNNRLYFGDNLGILAELLEDVQIHGNVRLVYIDPPFSTNSVYQSRSQIDAYKDLLTGSNYVEFLRERLILIRELLAEDGSIYVHLDNNMVFYVKIIMGEVFGINNFRNFITRKKCNPKNYTQIIR